MAEIPKVPPDDALDPQQLAQRVREVTNLDVEQLEAFKASEFNRAYNAGKSDAAQPGDEPLDDVIQLLDTPDQQWRDTDDGFNEVKEAEELLAFQRRTQGQIKQQGLGENYLTDREVMQFREAASIRWGIDPDDEREWL